AAGRAPQHECELRRGGAQRDAGAQAHYDLVDRCRPALLRNEIRRRAGVERVEWRAELGLGGEHTDDAVACAVDRRRLTDDRTVATELRLPRGVAEHDHTGRALGEVAGNKYSTDRGAQP